MKTYLLMIEGPLYSFPIGLYATPKEALKAAAEFGLRHPKEPDLWPDELYARQDIPGGLGITYLDEGENYLPEGFSVYEFNQGVPTQRKTVEPFVPRQPVITRPEPEEDWTIDVDQPFSFV